MTLPFFSTSRNPLLQVRDKSQAQNEAREVLQKMDASGLRYTRLLREVPLGARISCLFWNLPSSTYHELCLMKFNGWYKHVMYEPSIYRHIIECLWSSYSMISDFFFRMISWCGKLVVIFAQRVKTLCKRHYQLTSMSHFLAIARIYVLLITQFPKKIQGLLVGI